MNETMSLLIATAILATGGVGLYMYKSSENEPIEDRESEEKVSDDTGFFGKGGFFSSSSEDAEEEEEQHIRYEPKPNQEKILNLKLVMLNFEVNIINNVIRRPIIHDFRCICKLIEFTYLSYYSGQRIIC